MAKKSKYDLRIAILSDVHVGFTGHANPKYYGLGQAFYGEQSKWLEYALRYFKYRQVDAVVFPGDLGNGWAYDKSLGSNSDYAKKELKLFGEIFNKVFKGSAVQFIGIYGNHDGVCSKLEKFNGGNENVWENCFGEEYSPVVVKNVKGYSFVCGQFGHEQECKKPLKEISEKNNDKIVFYIQHAAILGTTYDSFSGSYLSDTGLNNVKDLENVIAITGHTHAPITDERTIWQADNEMQPKCTVISSGTFNYADSVGCVLSGDNLMTKHALLLNVKGNNVNVERLSFFTDEMLALVRGEKERACFDKITKSCGQDWNFVVGGERRYGLNNRTNESVAPEFIDGATIGVYEGDTFCSVFFPSAEPMESENDLIHSYYLEMYDVKSNKLVKTAEIATEHFIDHSIDFLSKNYQMLVSGLKPQTEYEIKVFARNCYQKLSKKPLCKRVKTLST